MVIFCTFFYNFVGELPLLRIENMFFKSQHFVDVIMRLIFDDEESAEDLANRQIVSLCKEISHVTVNLTKTVFILKSYFMWVNREVSYRYRGRKWLLFSPVERVYEWLSGLKKSFASSELGYTDNNHVINMLEGIKLVGD